MQQRGHCGGPCGRDLAHQAVRSTQPRNTLVCVTPYSSPGNGMDDMSCWLHEWVSNRRGKQPCWMLAVLGETPAGVCFLLPTRPWCSRGAVSQTTSWGGRAQGFVGS